MLSSISEILNQPDRKWLCNQPAHEIDIVKLVRACKVKLPEEYLDLLRFSNGGEGNLALPPLLFVLFDVDEVLRTMADNHLLKEFPNFLFFGSNGGLEQVAFDLRKDEPYPIVMIDPVAGEKSAVEIAPDIIRFIEAIGIESSEKY